MIEKNSKGFNSAKFMEWVNEWGEGPRLDFKNKVKDLTKEHELFDFVRHFIALANIARRTGKESRIVFGVDDQTRILFNVENQHPGRKPKGWNNPNVSIHAKQIDGVEEVYRKKLEDWIEPIVPDFTLEYGVIDADTRPDQSESVFVSYIVIHRTKSTKPFCLKQSYTKNNREYRPGDVFIRKNSSSVLLDPEEVKFLYQYDQAEYLDESEWKSLIKLHTKDPFKENYFDVLVFPPRLKGKYDQKIIDVIINALRNGIKSIGVTAHAGEGKTVLLHGLTYDLAIKHNIVETVAQRGRYGVDDQSVSQDHIVTSIQDELEVVPEQPVPIFLAMDKAFDTIDEFKSVILKKIQYACENENLTSLEGVFNIPGSNWVLLLDGLDEIRNREVFGSKLRPWIESLPNNVQVVITSRPHVIDRQLVDVLIPFNQLDIDDAKYILKSKVRDKFRAEGDEADPAKIAEQIENFLERYPLLINLILRQRAIDGLINMMIPYLNGTENEADQDEVRLQEKISIKHVSGGSVIPKILADNISNETTLSYSGYVSDDEQDKNTVFRRRVQTNINTLKNVIEKYRLKLTMFVQRILYKDSNDEGNIIKPELADAVKAIIDHINFEEEYRKNEMGFDTSEVKSNAEIDIKKTAWRTDWSLRKFNADQCKEHNWISNTSIKWNQDVGFIERDKENVMCFLFMCSLLQHFFAAAFAYDWYQGDKMQLLNDIDNRNIEHNIKKKIVDLYNGLCISNGKEEFTISIGG